MEYEDAYHDRQRSVCEGRGGEGKDVEEDSMGPVGSRKPRESLGGRCC